MEVVPDNEALVVEAHSGVDSINHLRTNQSTDIRFTGFNSRTTPMVRGRVTYVSADALLDKSGTPFYVFHVQPDSESLRNADISALRPGMAAEVFVLAERRSVVNYLFSPVSDTLRRALREP
jgi:multidrug efflux pump subunit AcrA (membrane-fusion protein)